MMATTTALPQTTPNAFVTLLTSDTYLPGALVLAASLRDVHAPPLASSSSSATTSSSSSSPSASASSSAALSNVAAPPTLQPADQLPFETVCIVTPSTINVQSIKALRRAFDLIIGVEPLCLPRSSDRALALLGRPDLRAVLTKLHVWRLVQYERLVFLDADTLVLRPLAHLFSLPTHFAAAPDTGWPDAFNSGVFVFAPSVATFADLRAFASTRGSWDGADQGLLNDYFGGEQGSGNEGPGGGWTRLSFRYNVTPNGGYTYAPAYQRYGADIMIAHFIGRHKPWYRPRPHPPGPSRGTVPSNDYDTLLSRWHDVYAAHYPSTSQGLSVVHTSRGVEIVERPFVVPTYQAVWDASAARARQFRPGQPEDLKAMFAAGHSAGAEPDDNAMGPAAPGEGRYISMPLEGRISLIGLPPEDDLPQGPSDGQGPQPRELSDPSSTPPKPPSPQDDSPPPSDSPSRPLSPPQVAWNPAMAPPPTGGGPADYQMRNPPDTFYTNAWDQPVPRGATRADHQAAFFRPAPGGTIPHTLQREHFFDNLGSDRPDPRRVKAVFPWEHEEERVRPTRVFPDEPPLVAPGSPRVEESLAAGSRSGYSGAAGSDGSGAASDPTNRPPDAEQVQAHPSYAPPTIHRGLPANLSYTNAWDDVATIGAYADRIAARTAGRASREGRAPPPSSVGAGTGPPSSSAGETQAFGTGAEDSTERRHPNYGYDPDDGDHSRDGDDESSSDSDDDDDQDPESNPPDGTGLPPTSDPSAVAVGERALPIPAPPGGWPRASPGRGYQRKAEAAAVAATGFVPPPRSPRHSRVVSASGLSVASSSSSNAQRTASAVPVGGLIGRRATSGGGGGSAGSGSQTTSPSGTPLARSPTMDMHHPHTSAGAGGGPGSGAGGSWGGRARRG